MTFIGIVFVIFVYIVFVTFAEALSAAFIMPSHITTESSIGLGKYSIFLQTHALGFQV